jgi:hypothetical protein
VEGDSEEATSIERNLTFKKKKINNMTANNNNNIANLAPVNMASITGCRSTGSSMSPNRGGGKGHMTTLDKSATKMGGNFTN